MEDTNTLGGGHWKLKAEGINIPVCYNVLIPFHFISTSILHSQVLWEHPDVFDLKRIHCNDIHYVADTYGIEAASKIIIKVCLELYPVFPY